MLSPEAQGLLLILQLTLAAIPLLVWHTQRLDRIEHRIRSAALGAGGFSVLASIQQLIKRHNAQLFGVLAVLLLWSAIVQPNLDAARAAQTQLVEITGNLASAARSLERIETIRAEAGISASSIEAAGVETP